jgi:hypothetical protein
LACTSRQRRRFSSFSRSTMLQFIRDALAENGATAPDALGKAVKAFGDGYTLETSGGGR